MDTKPRSHAVFFPLIEAWGHIRPLCVFASRAVRVKPFCITFFISQSCYDRVITELERSFDSQSEHLRKLIRVVVLTPYTGKVQDYGAMIKSANNYFLTAFSTLIDEKPVTCAQTQQQTEMIVAPNTVVIDTFFSMTIDPVRAKKKDVKIIGSSPGFASFYLYPFGPTRLGGRGDWRGKVLEEVQKSNRPLVEVAEEIMLGTHGTLLKTPGLPPMYDYEYYPQEMIFPAGSGVFWMWVQSTKDKCDALLLNTSEAYEPEAIAGFRDWFAETSRNIYAIGPLVPIRGPGVVPWKEFSTNPTEVETFLEQALNDHGERSLVYMSFGSLFWSTEPEKIFAFLDVLMEKRIPFIMSYASPVANIPESVAEKVIASGLGLLSKWCPQQTILAHPATGWFVTHCGHNSVIEAIALGVPLICWPYHTDQPPAAAHLTTNLDVAYDLIEVRTGITGLKPIHRLGNKIPVGTLEALRVEVIEVFDNAFGEDGARKRANMKRLQEKLLDSWSDGGSSKRDTEAFVNTFIV